jgi:hypothetical protein
MCRLISLVTTLTGNPPENTRSQNRTHLRLCCVFSNSLECGAPWNVSIVQAIYKLRTCYTRRRLSVLFRVLAIGRNHNLSLYFCCYSTLELQI